MLRTPVVRVAVGEGGKGEWLWWSSCAGGGAKTNEEGGDRSVMMMHQASVGGWVGGWVEDRGSATPPGDRHHCVRVPCVGVWVSVCNGCGWAWPRATKNLIVFPFSPGRPGSARDDAGGAHRGNALCGLPGGGKGKEEQRPERHSCVGRDCWFARRYIPQGQAMQA